MTAKGTTMRIAKFFTLLALLLVPGGFVRAGPAASTEKDSWYSMSVAGKKSGWMHRRTETKTVDGEKRFVNVVETSMTLLRGQSEMVILSKEMTEEDASGKVVRFEHEQNMGFQKKVTSGVLQPDGTLAIDESGRKRIIPYPTGAIGQVGAERLVRATGLTKGQECRFVLFSAELLGTKVEAHAVVGIRVDKDVLGRRRSLRPVVTTLSAIPNYSETTWIDDKGETPLIEVVVPMLGTMRLVETEEALAKRPGEPAEVFMSSLLAPDRAIPDPRKLKKAVFRLSPLKGKLGDIVTGVGQTAKRNEDGSLRVAVDARPPAGKERFELPYAGKDMASFLEPCTLLESDDPRVIALAKEAVGDEKDPIAAGKAIETLVLKRIIKKNLDVGFGSAAEVAEHLVGDCTEHGVLCAAMARAVGLPSRVVVGLVYVAPGSGYGGGAEGLFGYHMWAEVYVGGGEWLPIDAAIGVMDATHIALARSDLAKVNPVVDMTLPVLSFMGNLKIEVIEPRDASALIR
jgi:transglutaminase-like putative cysteine protease